MPFYEYRCSECQNEFESLARTMSARPPKCPKCGSSRVEKKLSTFGVRMGETAGSMSPGCMSCPQGASCPRAH